jgi:membrane fusion protein (multidrug efflux system)
MDRTISDDFAPKTATGLEALRARLSRLPRRHLAAPALAVFAALAGATWIAAAPASETTDNAYTAADASVVAPKVRGLVARVLVKDNETVHAGQPLIEIDPEEFEAKVKGAEADLADADAAVAAAQAALVSLDAEQRLAGASVVESRTQIRAADAEAARAAADRGRYDALWQQGAAARRDVDTMRATAVSAEQSAAKARASLAVAERTADVTAAQRASLQAALAKAQAARLHAVAALDLARQDRRNTLVRAPVDGVIGNRQARVGDYVQPGSALLSVVPVAALYVTANYKETQTRAMRIGQRATVSVDALGGRDLRGEVESFAPGSGSTFSLLPFEPGTGNFTKIVQRVPVRIRLEPGQSEVALLRPGLSVTAKVRVAD